jgi:hypothetical protein
MGWEAPLCHLHGEAGADRDIATFAVEGVSDIEWNEECISNLILPNGYKDLLLSLVEEKMQGGDGFDDFVEQKGQGLIVLLGGPTGVGKTLTAEAGKI